MNTNFISITFALHLHIKCRRDDADLLNRLAEIE